jgi:hypothetical protein
MQCCRNFFPNGNRGVSGLDGGGIVPAALRQRRFNPTVVLKYHRNWSLGVGYGRANATLFERTRLKSFGTQSG